MQYFGVPTCPYCKKRVNLIRTWSLKKQGEYQCPRCGGISNIFLSPLIYVFALLAVFAGGAVYFFHKFILDDISVSTALQVIIPFAVFFLLSLFLVYLAKPVIKKVSRAETEKKKRERSNFEDRRMQTSGQAGQTAPGFYDPEEYLPQTDYRTGPMPLAGGDEDMKIHAPAPRRDSSEEELQRTSVIEIGPAAAQDTARVRSVPPVSRRGPDVEYRQRPQDPPQSVQQSPRVVGSVEIPSVNDDFFAKYEDPDYIERRLRELKNGRDGEA